MKHGFAALRLALHCVSRRGQAQPPTPLFASDAPIHITDPGRRWRRSPATAEGRASPATLTDPTASHLSDHAGAARDHAATAETLRLPAAARRASPTPPPPASLFAGQKQLKLVTHCKRSRAFQQYVLLEYSAYRMYNLLTPQSFRARLANIDYRRRERPADHLARRLFPRGFQRRRARATAWTRRRAGDDDPGELSSTRRRRRASPCSST